MIHVRHHVGNSVHRCVRRRNQRIHRHHHRLDSGGSGRRVHGDDGVGVDSRFYKITNLYPGQYYVKFHQGNALADATQITILGATAPNIVNVEMNYVFGAVQEPNAGTAL